MVAGLLVPSAHADGPGWHSEQPVAAGIDVPAPLGEIGDIEFWAPNRGVLITPGNEALPAGIYAYDGTGWHLYSTVCGGHDGRIAWAGPDDFWTVSDYATRQEGQVGLEEGYGRTLCHFANGQVVASYAEPLGSAGSYQRMRAAGCEGPSDCWFAGEPLGEASPNSGAFHLHWDGTSLTALPSLTETQPQIEEPAGSITDLAFLAGGLFESATEAPFLRQVVPGQPDPFIPLTLPAGAEGPFRLSSDGSQLWAVGTAGTTALRSVGAGFETVPLEEPLGEVRAVASEPNGSAAWVGGGRSNENATVTRVTAGGSVGESLTLPAPGEELDLKGAASAIACPSAGQCWMATDKGWLFHFGGPLPQDCDPAMHVLITSRPPDDSTRSFVSPGLPEDTSGELEATRKAEEPIPERFPHHRKARALVVKVKQRIVNKTILQLSFVLRARADVQLIAKRHHKVVAKTPKLTLGKGPHRLRLHLHPEQWPTGLDFRVHPAGKSK
jgi:hypothetical protein